MTRQIFAAEINFEDAPLHAYEKFNCTEDNVRTLLLEFRPRVDEVFILATRQRFTVYIVHDKLQPLTDFFHSEHSMRGYVQYYYNSGESVTHLMATASGLLSPVKGENSILSDIMKCYRLASACSCLRVLLDHTVTKAIETGKKVRTATGIDHFCASLVETGLELIYSRLENLHSKNFLIIGTGELASLALECLCKEGFSHIAITGHDHKRAVRLARQYGVRTFPMEAMADYFPMADVVIGVSHQELEISFEASGTDVPEEQNCFILDFGMPQNFNSQWLERHATEFYNVDDLRRLQDSPLESFGGLEKAWRMVMKASSNFVHVLRLLQQSPVLSAYLNRQFVDKKARLEVKVKRRLKHMLLFRKDEGPQRSAGKESTNAKVHINNHMPENGSEIIRNFSHMKNFPFILNVN